MNGQAQLLINTAQRYLGVKESPPNSNNVVFNTRYYGRAVSGNSYPWCAVFVWCVFEDAGLSRLFYGGGKTASCTTLMNYAKKQGQFYTSDYRQGDLALYNWSGDKSIAEHIGIVTEAGSGYVKSIEGNTGIDSDSDGGEVMLRRRSTSLVLGVYRPLFEADAPPEVIEMRYDTVTDMPEWARPAVIKLIEAGYLQGSGITGNDGLPADLNLSEDMLRLIVINDRAGVYGN